MNNRIVSTDSSASEPLPNCTLGVRIQQQSDKIADDKIPRQNRFMIYIDSRKGFIFSGFQPGIDKWQQNKKYYSK